MSSNNYNNVVIASNNGQNHIIKGGFFELAGQTAAGRNVAHAASGQGSGIQFDSYDITISHADIQANSWHGITDNGSAGIVMGSFIGNKINGNSKATSNLDSGISLANSTAIYMAVGNMEYDAVTQRQGITAQNASNVSVTSNYMTGVTTGCNAITGTFKGSGNFGTGCP